MGRNLRGEIRPASPSMKGAVALHCLDLKWKQCIKVTCPHEMIDIESVGGSDRDFRRRERKGEIPGCRQPAFIAMVQQILLGRTSAARARVGAMHSPRMKASPN